MKITFFVSQPGSWDGSSYWFQHLNLIDFFDVVGHRTDPERVDLCVPIQSGQGPGTRWIPVSSHIVRMPFWASEADLLRRLAASHSSLRERGAPQHPVGGRRRGHAPRPDRIPLPHDRAGLCEKDVRDHPRSARGGTLRRSQTSRVGRILFPALMTPLETYGALLVRRGTECLPIASGLERQLGACRSTVVTPVLAPAFRLAAPRAPHVDDRVRLLYVGSLSGEKNLDLLIRSLKLLEDEPSWILTIAGSGPEDRSLRALVARLQLDARITFLGSVDHGKSLRQVYLAHEVFVLPSSTEGASQALAEAMGMGLCPVVSKVGGMQEMIGDLAPDSLLADLHPAQVASCLQAVLQEWKPYARQIPASLGTQRAFNVSSRRRTADGHVEQASGRRYRRGSANVTEAETQTSLDTLTHRPKRLQRIAVFIRSPLFRSGERLSHYRPVPAHAPSNTRPRCPGRRRCYCAHRRRWRTNPRFEASRGAADGVPLRLGALPDTRAGRRCLHVAVHPEASRRVGPDLARRLRHLHTPHRTHGKPFWSSHLSLPAEPRRSPPPLAPHSRRARARRRCHEGMVSPGDPADDAKDSNRGDRLSLAIRSGTGGHEECTCSHLHSSTNEISATVASARLTETGRALFVVGRVQFAKGLPTLVQAISTLRDECRLNIRMVGPTVREHVAGVEGSGSGISGLSGCLDFRWRSPVR